MTEPNVQSKLLRELEEIIRFYETVDRLLPTEQPVVEFRNRYAKIRDQLQHAKITSTQAEQAMKAVAKDVLEGNRKGDTAPNGRVGRSR